MSKPKRPRKTSQRNKTKRKDPAASARFKMLWADPVFREKMRVRDVNRIAAAKKNPELFWRRGVPDGMRKRDSEPLWARARELADRFIQTMKDTGELPADEVVLVQDGEEVHEVHVPNTDAGKAERALHECFVLAVGPSEQKIKIQAINTVLNFTKSKPEAKTKLTVNPLAFLDEIANDRAAD